LHAEGEPVLMTSLCVTACVNMLVWASQGRAGGMEFSTDCGIVAD